MGLVVSVAILSIAIIDANQKITNLEKQLITDRFISNELGEFNLIISGVTNDQVTVGNTSTAVVSANVGRVYAGFVNDSDEPIYLALGATAVMNKGIRLNAYGGSYEILPDNLYIGAVSAICSTGSKVLTFIEK